MSVNLTLWNVASNLKWPYRSDVRASHYDPCLPLLSGGDLLWPWTLLQQQRRKSEFFVNCNRKHKCLKIMNSLSQQKICDRSLASQLTTKPKAVQRQCNKPLSFAPALPYGGREMWFMVECVVQHVRTWSDTQHIKCLKVKYYHENLERSFKSCHPNSKRNDLYLSRRGTSEPKNHRCLEPDVDVSHSFHDTAK